jgi:hypothetical protein
MTKAPLNRWSTGVLFLVLVLPIVGLFACEIIVDRSARRDLLLFRSQLRIGATRSEIVDRFRRAGYPKLRLVELPNEIQIQTPFRFGAVNWDLWLTFARDRLTGVQVRTADGRSSRPRGGPADIAGP